MHPPPAGSEQGASRSEGSGLSQNGSRINNPIAPPATRSHRCQAIHYVPAQDINNGYTNPAHPP
eukprot:10391392-Lingulodinium_polyedra.AAC.1